MSARSNRDAKIKVELADELPAEAAVVAVLLFQESTEDEALLRRLTVPYRHSVRDLRKAKMFTGKANEVTPQLMGGGGGRLVVIGLGKRSEFSAESLRQAAGALGKLVRKQRLASVSVVFPAGLSETVAVDAIVTGFALGHFVYTEYRGAVRAKKTNDNNDDAAVANVALTLLTAGSAGADLRSSAQRALTVAEAQNFARTIASRPGNDINPPSLAKVAQEMCRASKGLKCRVLDDREMKKLGMGGILAVGGGSNATPPRLIVMEWRRAKLRATGKAGAKKRAAPLLVVGKAVTFDTGGISIKPAERMHKMVFDKCGAMAVMGFMRAIAALKLPIDVVGIMSAAENHISETSYRPGDILRMYNGVTVEVTNTDAEGRLVLGDALAWGIEIFKPKYVVDLATLTGGCVIALGHIWAGLMSNSDELVSELQTAGAAAGEKSWRLPIGDEVREMLKSEPADIVNSAGRYASPLTGGAFLSHFVPDDGSVHWAHLDIAGVADTDKDLPYYAKGATGYGVRTLVNWATTIAK